MSRGFPSLVALMAVLSQFLAFGALAGTLEDVRERGYLRCGVAPQIEGVAMQDEDGKWHGAQVDTCRVVAAAVLGDADAVRFIAPESQAMLTALTQGEVDLLQRGTSWTMYRDATMGLDFPAINYYEAQAFAAHAGANISNLLQVKGGSVCFEAGTMATESLADVISATSLPLTPMPIETLAEAFAAFVGQRCDFLYAPASTLAVARASLLPNPGEVVILPERFSYEPLGPVIRDDDQHWFEIIRWTTFAMIEAEELGLSQTEIASQRDAATDPYLRRLLGVDPGIGEPLGLDDQWFYRIVEQVGTYGDIYDRHVGANSRLKIDRGPNELWTRGGLIYSPPFR